MMTSNEERFTHAVQTVARINVTPIIDVALVLVIILLITAPMLSVTDTTLELPSSSAQAGDRDERIFVTLSRDGTLGVDDELVSPEALGDVLAARIAREADGGTLVVIRADRAAAHAEVRALLDAAHTAGAPRVAIATRPGDYR